MEGDFNNAGQYVDYIYDGLGDVTQRTNRKSIPTTALTYATATPYDAYGNSIITASSNKIGYKGYYRDSETGLYYLNARYYDSMVGRFTQSDPARQGGNLYGYCAGNPVMYSDPSGLWYMQGYSAIKQPGDDANTLAEFLGVPISEFHKYQGIYSASFVNSQSSVDLVWLAKENKAWAENLGIWETHVVALFAGINTKEETGFLDKIAEEITVQYKQQISAFSYLYTETFYDYNGSGGAGGMASGSVHVAFSAMTNIETDDYAKKLMGYNYDKLFMVGYSGGGITATHTAEKLMSKGYNVNYVVRVGSPQMATKLLKNKIVDLYHADDNVARIKFVNYGYTIGYRHAPRVKITGIQGLDKKWYQNFNPMYGLNTVHTSYWTEENGYSNLQTTISSIMPYFK